MDLLIKKFEEIKKIDSEWSKSVKDAQTQNQPPQNQDLVKVFNELFSEAQKAYKTDMQETEKVFEEYASDDCQWLLEDVKKSLEFYFTFSELRKIQNENSNRAKKVIDYLFENAIVYFDRQFSNTYAEFGFETRESFFDTARSLDALTEYYVTLHFAASAIKRDLKEETEFSDDICDYLTEKIQSHYQILQLNIVMDMLQMNQEN